MPDFIYARLYLRQTLFTPDFIYARLYLRQHVDMKQAGKNEWKGWA